MIHAIIQVLNVKNNTVNKNLKQILKVKIRKKVKFKIVCAYQQLIEL